MIRRAILPAAGALLLVAFLMYTLAYGFGSNPKAKPVDLAGATVKVINSQSHGSGVHIGNGYVITAAHVVGDAKTASVKTDDGGTVQVPVLWRNTDYDVALLRLTAKARRGVAALDLSCRSPAVGEAVEAAGNPSDLEFVRTWGRVSGTMRRVWWWGEALVVDISLAPGMSGGPLLDASGFVVGINVGGEAVPIGRAASLVGISYSVPGSTICNLMGRG